MKVAVYDRYWSTAGGGEKYAGGVAEVLSRGHDVTLIAHDEVDTDWLGERLGLDLGRTTVTVVDECEPARPGHRRLRPPGERARTAATVATGPATASTSCTSPIDRVPT